jgi:hypothetical protein
MKRNDATAVFAGLLSLVAAVDAAELRTVALTGQPAPGTAGGIVYESFASHYLMGSEELNPIFRGPVLNDAGQTAFRANVTGSGVDFSNYQGVWSEGSGSLALVARIGSAAPGGGNFGTYSGLELFTPVLNNAGQTAFYGAITDGGLGLWSEGSGSLALVARDGVHGPVLPSGVNFSFADIDESSKWVYTDFPVFNDAGLAAFSVAVTGSGVNGTNNFGTWSGVDLNGLALVARKGDQAAGLSAGVRYTDAQLPVGLNDSGHASLFSYLQGTGVNDTNDEGYWSGTPGSLVLLAREGSPAPGTPSGVTFRDSFAPVAINSSGNIAFECFLTGVDVVTGINDEGLWSNVSGALQLVARSGSQAAGAPAGVNYGLFSSSSWPLLNDSGHLAFHASLAGSGVDDSNNEGIWLGEAGDLALVARRGEQAPDTTSGVKFNDLNPPALNSVGQIAFRASISGDGVDFTNDRGIWATNPDGALQLIARTGDQIEVAPGDFRTLNSLDFVALSGNGDNRRSAFNNFGQLAFWASFTDGSQGVFVSNVVARLPGDFNTDVTVDAADYVIWRKNFSGDQAMYDAWRANFGSSLGPGSGSALPSAAPLSAAIPEPAMVPTLLMALLLCCRRLRATST